ncbi:hypothetical protein ABIA32_003831 [Streptacidiphilus sp. MAP12-20]|uniref:hypothetical protein n=1 Tax=Streptacidiphilus sp. MAP12-20 TaxID=3156299 RepID=UPI003517B568
MTNSPRRAMATWVLGIFGLTTRGSNDRPRDSIASARQPDGSYRHQNLFRYLISRA